MIFGDEGGEFSATKNRPKTLLWRYNLGSASGGFVCVLGMKHMTIPFGSFLGMKSDFRWPWHHRMKSPGWRCRCKTKSQNKVGWNMQLAFSRLRLVEVVFFLQSSLQACQLRHFQCAGMADFFLQRDAKKNDHSVWHALFTIWVHFVPFFLLHFKRSHRPQLSTFFWHKNIFEKLPRSKDTPQKEAEEDAEPDPAHPAMCLEHIEWYCMDFQPKWWRQISPQNILSYWRIRNPGKTWDDSSWKRLWSHQAESVCCLGIHKPDKPTKNTGCNDWRHKRESWLNNWIKQNHDAEVACQILARFLKLDEAFSQFWNIFGKFILFCSDSFSTKFGWYCW